MKNQKFWIAMLYPMMLVTHLVGRHAGGDGGWVWLAWGATLGLMTVLVSIATLRRPASRDTAAENP